MMRRLLSPNTWVAIFSLFAVAGMVLLLIGFYFDIPTVQAAGYALIAPLIIGGVLIVVVVVPILICSNRKSNRENDNRGWPTR
jgi:TRAP-type C4-dicarboxylate transport system permease small subunit